MEWNLAINPHSFMIVNFLENALEFIKTFDKIYSIDLHGNNKKKRQHLMVQLM
jgi:hypothetical protein